MLFGREGEKKAGDGAYHSISSGVCVPVWCLCDWYGLNVLVPCWR